MSLARVHGESDLVNAAIGFEVARANIEAVLEHESDRGAAIIGAALVEEALRALVTLTFDSEHAPQLRALGRYGAIGSLGGALEYAFAMGLISGHERSEADKVRRVRNSAAHGLITGGQLWSFASTQPTAWTDLTAADTERARFAIVTAGLVGKIWSRVSEAEAIKQKYPEGGRAKAIAWLLESVERPLLNRTYLALFDADPPSQDPFE